jgi:hypothetical protein
MNSTTQHTPGPWKIGVRGSRPTRPDIYTDSGGVIASTEHASDEHSKANARLIAAAPELLEHLKRMVNISLHPNATRAAICQIALDARGAIAKASGAEVQP